MFRTTVLLKLFLIQQLLIQGVCSGLHSPASSPSSPIWFPETNHHRSMAIWDHNEQLMATKDLQRRVQPQRGLADIKNKNINDDVLYLSLKFSVWYPALQGRVISTPFDTASERFVVAVLGVLRDFLCQDRIRKISVVHALNHTQSLCRDVKHGYYENNSGLENDLNVFHATNATILSQKENVETKVTPGVILVADRMDGGVEWMSWEVIYQIVHVGRPFWELSASSTTSASSEAILNPGLLQEPVQDTLDEKIPKGNLDKRLQKYLNSSEAKLSLLGKELETFSESSVVVIVEDYYDSEGAQILRWIGVALIACVIWTCILLTAIARNKRLNLESKEIEKEGIRQARLQNYQKQQTQPNKCDDLLDDIFLESYIFLDSDDNVNHMLSMGEKVGLRTTTTSSSIVDCDSAETDIESGTARTGKGSPMKASATSMTAESSPRSDDLTYADFMETEIIFQKMDDDDVHCIHFMGRKESIKAMGESSLFLKPFVSGLKITEEL